jgi:hypothetical protein
LAKWRGRLEASTFTVYYTWTHRFLHSIGKSPDEAITWARETQDKHEVLDAVQTWVNSLTARYNTKRIAYATLRSFFLHNRVDLPSDRWYRMRGDEAPVERKLTVDHVRTLIGLAIQPWRSAILVKWQALLDNEGLIYVSNHHADAIVKALKANAEICKLTIPGRKRTRNERGFYTFIGPEALASLREYFETERGWPKPNEPVWVYATVNHRGQPIQVRAFQEAWMRLLRRARLIPKEKSNDSGTRYGFNMHNTRDLAISLLNTAPGFNPLCAEFWAGHEIDPLGYNQFYNIKPQYVEQQYRLALPYLSIIGASANTQTSQEVESLRAEIEKLKGQFETLTRGRFASD